MKKKKILCGALLASTMIGMVSCNSSEDFEVLSRKDFAENAFQKDSSQIVRFDLKGTAEFNDRKQLSLFFIAGAFVAVVAVAYAAVVADVIVIGPAMADNGANVLQAVENGDILSLDLQKIGGDEIINKKIDDTILKSLVLQGETHSKIETVQNIAKATYYEFK